MHRFRRPFRIALTAAACLLLATTVRTQNNQCDQPGEAPDVIVGDLYQTNRYGVVAGVTGFSVGTISCNVGSCWLDWFGNSNRHPVIGQNMFRLKDGRFEQIGQSWLKHGFNALSQEFCDTGCLPTIGTHLGVNCSDPYTADLNGEQDRLGPKFEVDPSTGDFSYPFTDQGQTGDAIYKRLQVSNDDLDPALNPGAQYFVEGQYVTPDDAAAGNQHNNASWRPVDVTGAAGVFDIALTETTRRTEPGIMAWQQREAGVELTVIDVPTDGRFILAAKATALGGGQWHYEYALQNLNSHRAGVAFEVPIPHQSTPANVGFHDVDYHSGEPFAGTDWPPTVDSASDPNTLTWMTDDFGSDPDANALRWGTLYNFRFDASTRPVFGEVTLHLFRPGSPAFVRARTIVPDPCDADGICDPGEQICNCADCGTPATTESSCSDAADDDCDGRVDCADGDCCLDAACAGPDDDGDGFEGCDCNDDDGDVWLPPGEVTALSLAKDPVDGAVLSWAAPLEPGATSVSYETLRSGNPADFVSGTACLPDLDPLDLELADGDLPAPAALFGYLVRARNGCDPGRGGVGRASSGIERSAIACP